VLLLDRRWNQRDPFTFLSHGVIVLPQASLRSPHDNICRGDRSPASSVWPPAEILTMDISRRTFLQTGLVGGAALSAFGFDVAPVHAQARALKIDRTTETRSTCPYCSVSCGVIIHTLGSTAKNAIPQVVHVEGDPDHPINRGTLCPKGSSLEQEILNERRLTKPQVRRPGSDRWEDIPWDDAINEIGRWVKKTRDETFVEKDQRGRTVNRCEGIAWTGGCTDTNEINYLNVKTMRSLGVCYIETQARV
jgi:formate dehydrogenase major subunit